MHEKTQRAIAVFKLIQNERLSRLEKRVKIEICRDNGSAATSVENGRLQETEDIKTQGEIWLQDLQVSDSAGRMNPRN